MAAMRSDDETVNIAKHAGLCLDLFESGITRFYGPGQRIAEEHLLRFNLWASNIGVFAGAHASLDYRLRDAPSVKGTVVSILNILRAGIEGI